MEDLERELLDLEPGQSLEKGRPSFLTGLCITSWAGCGLMLIYSIWQLFMYSQLSNSAFGIDMSDLMTAIFIDIAGIIIVAISIFGIWNQKKWGFFLYIPGELMPALSGLFMLGALQGISGVEINLDVIQAWLFSFSGILSFWIPLIFIIAYATHYKFLS